jgi:hypothetical protein
MNEQGEYGDRTGGQWRIVAWAGVIGLLVFVAILQSTTGAPEWTASDYVFMAVLLGAPLLVYEMAVRKSTVRTYRAATGLALCAVTLLIWINAAVGIIGSEGNPANLMYAGVLLILLSGAFVARFEASGMARTMRAAGFAQVVVTLIAIVGGLGMPSTGPLELIVINGFFLAFWVAASVLFDMAAGKERASQEMAQ